MTRDALRNVSQPWFRSTRLDGALTFALLLLVSITAALGKKVREERGSGKVCQRREASVFARKYRPANDEATTIDGSSNASSPTVREEQCGVEERPSRSVESGRNDLGAGDEAERRIKKRYKKWAVTNREDNKIRHLLDAADDFLDAGKLEDGLAAFEKLKKTYPRSPRASFGLARAFELIAAKKRSNAHLESCIKEYLELLYSPNVPDDLAKEAAKRLVDRARFRGWLNKAAQGQRRLLEMFPSDSTFRNDLGVTYLMMGRNDEAKGLFRQVLSEDAKNGFALVHYGFLLKTVDDNLREGAEYLRRGVETGADGTQDGRFYFHLGDALQRLNRSEEAYEWYEKAAARGVFLSKMQRSLYNAPGLTARPFWTMAQTPYGERLKAIESAWETIRDEGLALLDRKEVLFKAEDEKLTNAGDWKQFTLYKRGGPVAENCKRAPRTCAIVAQFPESVGCTRGQVKFSVMTGGTRVWPHCGPTNCRLRAHLGLVVPPGPRIRVGGETRSWREGEFLILDDSFEHEVWHEGRDFRLILIVDFWHPDLDERTRTSLPAI